MSTAKPRIVVTDYAFSDLNIERDLVNAAHYDFEGGQCKTEAALIDLCRDADAVITQFARISPNVINAMTRAKVIVRYGIGVDNVDLEAARLRKIPVCNIPDYCIDEVADHALAFILATTRQVVPHTNHLHSGQWGLVGTVQGMRVLRDQTVGVVGFGRIGRAVVKRLLAFGTRVVVFDPVVAASEIEKLGAQPLALDDLLKAADIVTLHCPSLPQTRKMINAQSLGSMKRGAILINVGRGDLVDVPALMGALTSGHISAAALDVFDPEPIPADHPVLKCANVILAPHIASASPAAMKKLRETAATLALKAVRFEPLPSIVNGVKA